MEDKTTLQEELEATNTNERQSYMITHAIHNLYLEGFHRIPPMRKNSLHVQADSGNINTSVGFDDTLYENAQTACKTSKRCLTGFPNIGRLLSVQMQT